jgi:uncharacterized protein (DUF1330 family)
MTAYVIVDIEVLDPENYKEYVMLAPETVKLYGGRYLARAGKTETLEGGMASKTVGYLRIRKYRKS